MSALRHDARDGSTLDPSALRPGFRLHEYEVERVLGHGGFAITYLARDHNLQKRVAIKEYLPTDIAFRADNGRIALRGGDARRAYDWGREQFVFEAQVLARFAHPHIVAVHRFFEDHDTAYIVMQFVEGTSLEAHCRRRPPLPEDELLRILCPVLDGLGVVHEQGVLHRDIKPANIILRDDGCPVLIDFGAARQDLGRLTRSSISLFTPGYTPMEQYSENGAQGPWTDLYSVGAVAYAAITGMRPVDAISRLQDDPLVPVSKLAESRYPAPLLAAVDWALEPLGQDRPQNVAELVGALRGAQRRMRTAAPLPASLPGRIPAEAAAEVDADLPRRPHDPAPTVAATEREPRIPLAGVVAALLIAGAVIAATVIVNVSRLNLAPAPGAIVAAEAAKVPAAASSTPAAISAPSASPPPAPAVDPRVLRRQQAKDKLAEGHAEFRAGRRTHAASAYAQALALEPELQNDATFARYIVACLSWASAQAMPLIRAHPSPPVLQALAQRSGENGRLGRDRAARLLTELGRPDLIDRTAMALFELAEAKTCEQKLPPVRMLRANGDPRALPALRQALGSGIGDWFRNSCIRADATAAIADMEAKAGAP